MPESNATQTVRLPVKINGEYKWDEVPNFHKTKALYEAIGISVTGQDNGQSLYLNAVLPMGWTLIDKGGYWSYVYDGDGNERLSIFTKLAPWDTDVFANIRKA